MEPYEAIRWEAGPWDIGSELENNGLYALKAIRHRPGASWDSLVHWGQMRATLPAFDASATLQLSFVGDIMGTGSTVPGMDGVAPLLDGEWRLGNLETPVDPSQPIALPTVDSLAFNSPPELLDALPLDAVQLNNNHSLDWGDAGLEATMAEVEAAGLLGFGVDAGATLWTGSGHRIEVLSFTWGLNDPNAVSTHELFVAPFGQSDGDWTAMLQTISAARDSGADAVVVLTHWGFEYEYFPAPETQAVARDMVAAGADVVVGHGPHVVQPAERCLVNIPAVGPGVGTCSVRSADGQPRVAAVFYSLGNFGTTQPGWPLRSGLVGHVSLEPGQGVTGLGWDAVVHREDGGSRLVPLVETDPDPELAAEAARIRTHLGVGWQRIR